MWLVGTFFSNEKAALGTKNHLPAFLACKAEKTAGKQTFTETHIFRLISQLLQPKLPPARSEAEPSALELSQNMELWSKPVFASAQVGAWGQTRVRDHLECLIPQEDLAKPELQPGPPDALMPSPLDLGSLRCHNQLQNHHAGKACEMSMRRETNNTLSLPYCEEGEMEMHALKIACGSSDCISCSAENELT